MACPLFPFMAINLTEKYPGYRILDKNSAEYQMEAFVYTCVILLFYTIATGAFMVKFILQGKEPWEIGEMDPNGPASVLPMVLKLREQEQRKKLVEREARRDVKMRMINKLHQMNLSSRTNRKASTGSVDTQTTMFSTDRGSLISDKGPLGSLIRVKGPRGSLIGEQGSQKSLISDKGRQKSLISYKGLHKFDWERERMVERTLSDNMPSQWQRQPLPWPRSYSFYQHSAIDMIDDTLVSL